ncbi:MAG: hypothetical protein ABW321_10705, partial [Polyangiales bacterium]
MLFSEIDWPGIERLRAKCAACDRNSLEAAAQDFAALFAREFESVVLARVFAVLPLKSLPEREREFARVFVNDDQRLGVSTPVLTLLGSAGRDASWHGRNTSKGHLAIPLLDQRFVQGAPMIAKLLSDLDIDLKCLDDGRPIATRQMLGGRNGTFYVPDAQVARDDRGRSIIPARDFVTQHQVRTVFGMGGAYTDGGLVAAIVFTGELLDRPVIERFPSL